VRRCRLLTLCLFFLLILPIHAQEDDDTSDAPPFVFGMILVGPKDDGGWSQSHYEGGLYVEEQTNARMLVYENYNPGATPDQTLEEIVRDFIDEGAALILLTSESFQAEAEEVAPQYPLTPFVHIAGDSILAGSAPDNLGNLMGQMEWAKLIAGCTAAINTNTGRIGYLGPLINSETRRLAASAYLGARHCYDRYRLYAEEPLVFQVSWVGFWYFIPGQTEDPVELTHAFYDDNVDVVISGIDTPEALVVADERRDEGDDVYAISYNSEENCRRHSIACLGTAYFNWGPNYLTIVEAARDGEWEPSWDWITPVSLYSAETIVGFEVGPAYPITRRNQLQEFTLEVDQYSRNPLLPNSLPLWQGPLMLQDGTLLADENELVNILDVWYLPQLLAGMEGDSFPDQSADE
jgi:simple sugar transport system substrate-binding protein